MPESSSKIRITQKDKMMDKESANGPYLPLLELWMLKRVKPEMWGRDC